METKLFKAIGCLVFVLLAFVSCVNEDEMLLDEQRLETRISRAYPADTRVKMLINYEGSTRDKNALTKVENLLATLYEFVPDIQYVIDGLIDSRLKVNIIVRDEPGSSEEAWCNPHNPPEIGFNGNVNITLGRLLHELLHLFAFHAFDVYKNGLNPACEEYETRVLTDLYMRRYFRSYGYTYQGMPNPHDFYNEYIAWLDAIINNDNYSLDVFVLKFKEYGAFCLPALKDAEKFNLEDLNKYKPLLAGRLWFYGKN